MKDQVAVLFDMDGVIVDTEPQYDILWKSIGEKYVPEIEGFEKKIKGTILPNILKNYFSHLPETEHQVIENRVTEFELHMDFFEVPGAMDFLRSLKEHGIKTGLVTSSGDEKVKEVSKVMGFDGLFDTFVSAGRIKQGKPDPMCYLLAAHDLGVDPENCYVFEDSFAGIQAGKAAGMKVIGLSTTNPVHSLEDKVLKVIPDFKSFTVEQMCEL